MYEPTAAFFQALADHDAQRNNDLGKFYLQEKKMWIARCRDCNHQVKGPFPQTRKSRQSIPHQLPAECPNCAHLAQLAEQTSMKEYLEYR